MISYSGNLEDVILQRALAGTREGHYLDIGAAMPVEDSTTYALYERGWSGIVVDPLLNSQHWRQERPRDIVVAAMAGATPGAGTIHVYPLALQASTGSEAARARLQFLGLQGRPPVTVPRVTANDLLAEHGANRPLHLVSIDVEGMEAEVLAGLDLRRHRPWVMMIEAVLPGTPTPSHHAWEPAILAQVYSRVYFDGVNRFYLADEQRGLLDHFAVPPNVFDQFIRNNDRRTEQRIAELQARIAILSAELVTLRPRNR